MKSQAGGLVRSAAGPWISALIAVASGLGAGVALMIGLADLFRGHPIRGLSPMLAPGLGSAIVAVFWSNSVAESRREASEAKKPVSKRFAARRALSRQFGDLDHRVVYLFAGLALLGAALVVLATPHMTRGWPDGGTADCPYRLNIHGFRSCVSHQDYDRAGAAEQQTAAGMFVAVFSLATATAVSAIPRRQNSDNTTLG